MNLVSIFSFKMPLQILYLSVGFKQHLSNKVMPRLRILNGALAAHGWPWACWHMGEQGKGFAAPARPRCNPRVPLIVQPNASLISLTNGSLVIFSIISHPRYHNEMPAPESCMFSFAVTFPFLLARFDP